jgi:hypothetical protein
MAASLPADVHPHHYWMWLRKEYNLGDFYYFDVWPMGPPTLIICNADVAEQITVKHSLDKHPMVKDFLKQHLGVNNIAAANGQVWRKARTIYNPGFAVSHLMTVISTIIEDVLVFRDVLDEYAESQEVIELEEVAMKLSFDVIGRLVLYELFLSLSFDEANLKQRDMELSSQRKSNVLVNAFRKTIHEVSNSNTWSSPLHKMNPIRAYSIAQNSKVIDRFLGDELDRRYASISDRKTTNRQRSMLDVALDTYNSEIRGMKAGTSAAMDPEFRQSAIDQYVRIRIDSQQSFVNKYVSEFEPLSLQATTQSAP